MTDRMESAKLQELLCKITQGNWRAEALGVTSDVLHGMDEICSASSQTKDPDFDMELMAEAARLAAEVLELRETCRAANEELAAEKALSDQGAERVSRWIGFDDGDGGDAAFLAAYRKARGL